MLPPAIALFSSISKQEGIKVDLFDTTYHATDESFDSDKEKEKNLQVRPFSLDKTKIQIKSTNVFADLVAKVDQFAPDLIAASCVEDTFPLCMRLIDAIRDRGIPTLLGGVFATFAPEKVIAHEGIDMVCVGEGEAALLELCCRMRDSKPIRDIPNLWIKEPDGSIIRNPLGAMTDIDDLPLPDFTVFEEARLYRPMAGKVYRMVPVETHRGCPYSCTYCNSPAQTTLYKAACGTSFFRKRSMESVHKELAFLTQRWKAEYIYFSADTFLAWTNKEFDAFVEMYADYKLPFWCQTRPETITPYRMEKLKSVGLHRMSIGIEHGNEAFRKEVIKRRISNQRIIQAFRAAEDFEIPISINNIVGFPDETRSLAFDTIELNRMITFDTGNCYAFTPFHGSPLREVCVNKGYVDESSISTCLTRGSQLDMPQFPKEQIAGLMRTFNLYVRFPKDRWPEIEKAEQLTPDGEAEFERLRGEFIKEFYSEKQ